MDSLRSTLFSESKKVKGISLIGSDHNISSQQDTPGGSFDVLMDKIENDK
jgi:hypothetical protein